MSKLKTNLTESKFPVIVHCHLRWDGVWQRPQQFLSRLSKTHEVLFVEGPILMEGLVEPRYELRTVAEFPSVTVMQTFLNGARFHDGAWVDEQRYRLLQQALAGPLAGRFARPVQWFYDPMAAPCFLGKLNETAVVYDCMDELSQFRFAPPEIVIRERKLIAAADVIFAGGRKLHFSKSRHHHNVHFYSCGVEVEHFSKAQFPETPIPSDLNYPGRKIFGYFGVVDERLDYELIAKLAAADPNWIVAIIGPTAKVDPNSLPHRPNLLWLGRREYAALPSYVKAFTACLMPFAVNEATEFINPTKALEYLAAAKPVVSTAISDVVTGLSDVVKIGHNHDDFIGLCRMAATHPEKFAISEGVCVARQNLWECKVANMENHILDVLRRRNGAGLQSIKTRRNSAKELVLQETWETNSPCMITS